LVQVQEDLSRKRPKKAKFLYFPSVNPPNIELNPTVGGHPKCSSSTKYPAFERSEKNKPHPVIKIQKPTSVY
jgi:hypothetical protein